MKTNRTAPLFFLVAFKLFMLLSCIGNAQPSNKLIKLKDAIDYGLTHNTGVQKSKMEIDRNQKKINEGISNYLPQVKGSGSIMNNLKLQTSILPGEIVGTPGTNVAVQFGTKYNVTAGIDASQVLYDQSLLTTISAAKESKTLAVLNEQKTEEQLIYDIATAYYSAEITGIQKNIIVANLKKTDTLILVTKSQYENGIAKKIDYDRLLVNQTNTKNDLQNVELNYNQQLLLLKYYMGYPLDSTINLPTGVNMYESPHANTLSNDANNNTDLKVLGIQKNLYALNLKQIRAGYMPTLSLGFKYAYQAQQNTSDFLSSKTNWFPNSYLALNLSVPIFDGFNKHAKTQQLKIQIAETQLDEKNLIENLKMQNLNASYKMQINQSSVTNQFNNINLAEDIYKSTQVQFQSGVASMSDLLNAEISLKEAQTNYLKALVQVKVAELDILKASGNLKSIIK